MNIYVAFSLFSITILIYWIISELFTMVFRFTGLPMERARFQVMSLITGCGFTTRESEMVISSRSRRRLARIIMLFGYVLNITIVSAFINVFLSLKLSQVRDGFIGVLIPMSAAAIIFAFTRIPKVRARGDRMIEALAGRLLHQDTSNTVLLMDYIGEDLIAQVNLREVPEELAGKPLSEMGLRTEANLLVMLVERPGQKAEPAAGDTQFFPGDKLTVFGDYASICRVFRARELFTEE